MVLSFRIKREVPVVKARGRPGSQWAGKIWHTFSTFAVTPRNTNSSFSAYFFEVQFSLSCRECFCFVDIDLENLCFFLDCAGPRNKPIQIKRVQLSAILSSGSMFKHRTFPSGSTCMFSARATFCAPDFSEATTSTDPLGNTQK